MIADDHAVFLEALKCCLQKSYLVIGTVTDGRSLVTEAIRLKPDLIIVDVSMPLLNGFDAARRIRERASECLALYSLRCMQMPIWRPLLLNWATPLSCSSIRQLPSWWLPLRGLARKKLHFSETPLAGLGRATNPGKAVLQTVDLSPARYSAVVRGRLQPERDRSATEFESKNGRISQAPDQDRVPSEE